MSENPIYKRLLTQYFQGGYVYNYGGFIPRILTGITPPSPSPTPTNTPTNTPTFTPTNTPTFTPTSTITPTATPTYTPTPSSVVSYYLLYESSDVMEAENGDLIEYEH